MLMVYCVYPMLVIWHKILSRPKRLYNMNTRMSNSNSASTPHTILNGTLNVIYVVPVSLLYLLILQGSPSLTCYERFNQQASGQYVTQCWLKIC